MQGVCRYYYIHICSNISHTKQDVLCIQEVCPKPLRARDGGGGIDVSMCAHCCAHVPVTFFKCGNCRLYISAFLRVCVCVCVCMYVCMYMCAYVCVCDREYLNIYTYERLQMNRVSKNLRDQAR